MGLAATRAFDAAPLPLVGRERERAFLRSYLDAALAGRGRLVLLGGEAGVRKSAPPEDPCQDAGALGAPPLTGHCYDLTETPPYGPWREMLGRDRGQAPRLPDATSAPAPDFSATSQATPFDQTYGFLAAVAAHRPLVLILEDCHW